MAIKWCDVGGMELEEDQRGDSVWCSDRGDEAGLWEENTIDKVKWKQMVSCGNTWRFVVLLVCVV